MSAQTEEQDYAFEGGIDTMDAFPDSEGEEIQEVQLDSDEQEIQEVQVDETQDDEKSVEGEDNGDDEPVVADPSVREELLFRAAGMNLPRESILALSDTDSLRTVVEMQERLQADSVSLRTVVEMQERLQADSVQAGSETQGDDLEPPKWYELPEGFDENMVDPEQAEILKGMNEGMKGAVEQLVDYKVASRESELRTQMERISNETSAERDAQFDEALQSLGKEWESVFGAGYLDEVRQGSAEHNNRNKVFEHMMSNGIKGSIAKRAVSAAKALFPDKIEKLAKQSNVVKSRDRQGKFVGRGAERSKLPGEISAKERLNQKLTEQGYDMSDAIEGELDSFPDAE